MQKLLSLIFISLISFGANAQKIIKAKVLDQDDLPVPGVKVEEFDTKNVAYTDMDGAFSMRYSSVETNAFIFSHPSYDSLVMQIQISESMIIYMTKTEGENDYILDGYAGFIDLSVKNKNKHYENMPYFLGEADINRQLQMLPGIEHGAEGFSNLFVRGGEVDQNWMYYNGTPIYNFNHLYGISSVFHHKTIQNTKLYKGIAPAKYGGKASSVILLESATSSDYSGLDGEFEISPLTAGIYIRSIKNNKHYFTIAGRRSWIDLLFPSSYRENVANLNFFDLQVNYGRVLANGAKIETSVMGTRDLYGLTLEPARDTLNPDPTQYKWSQRWGNFLASTRYSFDLSKSLSFAQSLHYSSNFNLDRFSEEVNFDPQLPNAFSQYDYRRGIRDLTSRSEFVRFLSNKHQLEFGLVAAMRMFRTGYVETVAENYSNVSDYSELLGDKSFSPSFEVAAYGESHYRLSDQMRVDLGLRPVLFVNGSYVKAVVEPRLNVVNNLSSKDVFKLGFNVHHQFLQQLNVGNSGSTNNLWVPATELLNPLRSIVLDVTYERRLGKILGFTASAYYKAMKNINQVSNIFSLSNADEDWQQFVFQGTGSSYGAEFMLMINEGNTGWVSYVVSKSTRNFPDLFEEDYLFTFDRTHMFKAYFNLTSINEVELGFNFLAGSGRLFTLPSRKFRDLAGNIQLEYSGLNNYRSQPYYRMDISLTRQNPRSSYERIWRFYVYNVIGARNPINIAPVFENNIYTNITVERTYLAFVPGVSFTIKF